MFPRGPSPYRQGSVTPSGVVDSLVEHKFVGNLVALAHKVEMGIVLEADYMVEMGIEAGVVHIVEMDIVDRALTVVDIVVED